MVTSVHKGTILHRPSCVRTNGLVLGVRILHVHQRPVFRSAQDTQTQTQTHTFCDANYDDVDDEHARPARLFKWVTWMDVRDCVDARIVTQSRKRTEILWALFAMCSHHNTLYILLNVTHSAHNSLHFEFVCPAERAGHRIYFTTYTNRLICCHMHTQKSRAPKPCAQDMLPHHHHA